jgi:hypothetical protein
MSECKELSVGLLVGEGSFISFSKKGKVDSRDQFGSPSLRQTATASEIVSSCGGIGAQTSSVLVSGNAAALAFD